MLVGNNCKSQTVELSNTISLIEELSTWSQTIAGEETKFTTSIEYSASTQRVHITELINFFDVEFNKREITFYLDEIDPNSFKYSYGTGYEDSFVPYVEISTNNQSVEIKTTKWEKEKEYLAVSDKSYSNKIRVTANMNRLSKYLSKKYVNLWYKLSGCTNKNLLEE